jgi:hypothetical protein
MKALGWMLVALATFMFVGYLGADVGGAQAIAALAITVFLPVAAGVALISGRVGTRGRLGARREALRLQTIEAELLRLARRHAGRLTLVEVVSELAVRPRRPRKLSTRSRFAVSPTSR